MLKLEKKDTKLTVLLNKNQLDDSTHVGKLIRNTFSVENLIQEIVDTNTGVDYLMVSHAGELLKREILRQVQKGYAVNVLGLGTLYLAPGGAVKGGDNPSVTDIPGFTARFTPSAEAKEAASSVQAELVVKNDTTPLVSSIMNLSTGKDDGVLTAGKSVRLTGSRLKTGGTGSGIFFVPCDAAGNAETDESKWTAVNADFFPRNTNKTLEFECPAAAAATKFLIAVRTAVTGSGEARKEPVTGMSSMTVTVEA